jgi:hypothetical protein
VHRAVGRPEQYTGGDRRLDRRGRLGEARSGAGAAGAIALGSRIAMLAAGTFRLGFMADSVSRPVLVAQQGITVVIARAAYDLRGDLDRFDLLDGRVEIVGSVTRGVTCFLAV